MSDFLIRPVVPEDYAQWLPLWRAYNAFYGRSGATALPDIVTETAWARFLDPVEPMSALVAIKDGMIAGLAHYLFHRSTSAIEMSCYMQDLYTLEAQRGQGIARGLIEAVYDPAKRGATSRI